VVGTPRLVIAEMEKRSTDLKVKVLNNLDWFGGMGFLDFLRDYGKLVRVGAMLSREA
jgi:tyrosyl-tRNA synthetase